MVEVDIPLHDALSLARVPLVVERACAEAGLKPTLTGTVARYAGSRHWHFRMGQARGTLEVTFWPAERRLWLKVAAGRQSTWTEAVLPKLAQALTAALEARERVGE
jgi:hypothetical protein